MCNKKRSVIKIAVLFEKVLNVKPRSWERTGGNGRLRFTPKTQREYYQTVYMTMLDEGMRAAPAAPVELGIEIEFHTKDRRWRDIDNLEKAFFDAGQVSKWRGRIAGLAFCSDFWDDKQFAEVHKKRVRGAESDCIKVRIWTN